MKKKYIDYAGLKRVLKHLLPGARKIWHGTAEEWHDLSDEERDKYDQAEIIDGSGYEETTIMPLTPNSNFTGGDIGFTKNGKNVTLTFPNIKAVSDKGSTLIAKLPLGVMPTINGYFTLWGFANNENIVRLIQIRDDGDILVAGDGISSWFNNGVAIPLWGTVSFISR